MSDMKNVIDFQLMAGEQGGDIFKITHKPVIDELILEVTDTTDGKTSSIQFLRTDIGMLMDMLRATCEVLKAY